MWSLAAGGEHALRRHRPERQAVRVDKGGKRPRGVRHRGQARHRRDVTSDGGVWLGTSERALVFRYDPKTGKTTRAMADFAGNEIAALAA
jgi:hypothetical protein